MDSLHVQNITIVNWQTAMLKETLVPVVVGGHPFWLTHQS